MTFEDVVGVDRAEIVVGSRDELTLVDELGDACENLVLLDHVVGLEHRAGEHELPTHRDGLHFEGPRHVEVSAVSGDENDAALRGDHFSHGLPYGIDFVEVGDVVNVGNAKFTKLRWHVATVADDVIGAKIEAPIAAFFSRGGGDHGEASTFGELDGDRADTSGTADDEEGLAVVLAAWFRMDTETVKERFPCGERGEGKGGAGSCIEESGLLGDDSLVDELKLSVRARAGDITGVVDLVAYLEKRDLIANRDDGASGIEAQCFWVVSLSGSDLVVDRIEANGFDFHKDVVSSCGGRGNFDFAGRSGLAAVFKKLDGFHELAGFLGEVCARR